MLQSLTIKNFVIVENLELKFENGFTVFTGETGAGKSILIDALTLLLGKRATTLKIRQGCEKAEITAFFKVSSPELKNILLNWCEQFGFDFDSDEILIRRVIEKTGKSRAWINGHISTVNQVKEIGEWLMEIHSQNAHQKLLIPDYQRKILDDFGNIKPDVEKLKTYWEKWNLYKHKLHEAHKKNDFFKQKKNQLTWEVSLIDNLNLQKNEWEEISASEKKLSSIAEILEVAEEGLNQFQRNDDSIISITQKLQRKFSNLIDKDSFFDQIYKSIEQSLLELKDTSENLSRYIAQNDIDPHAFKHTSERLAEIFSVSQKIGCKPQDLTNISEERKKELVEIETENDLETLEKSTNECKEKYLTLANHVSEKRCESAKKFQILVTDWLKKLAMENTDLNIHISKKQISSPSGLDDVNFLIKHRGNENSLKINKIASGGELSRISLAISVVMANASKTPSLIFDEVDSGIGGNTAHTVGKLLKLLGNDQQILCVTHLPQVAANGHNHFYISKNIANTLATSIVKKITDNERVNEIARMLGSGEQLDASIVHAKALLRDQ